MKTKKRVKLEFISDSEIYYLEKEIYGYTFSKKRSKKNYTPNKVFKKEQNNNKFS
jgi:hypothetical protein